MDHHENTAEQQPVPWSSLLLPENAGAVRAVVAAAMAHGAAECAAVPLVCRAFSRAANALVTSIRLVDAPFGFLPPPRGGLPLRAAAALGARYPNASTLELPEDLDAQRRLVPILAQIQDGSWTSVTEIRRAPRRPDLLRELLRVCPKLRRCSVFVDGAAAAAALREVTGRGSGVVIEELTVRGCINLAQLLAAGPHPQVEALTLWAHDDEYGRPCVAAADLAAAFPGLQDLTLWGLQLTLPRAEGAERAGSAKAGLFSAAAAEAGGEEEVSDADKENARGAERRAGGGGDGGGTSAEGRPRLERLRRLAARLPCAAPLAAVAPSLEELTVYVGMQPATAPPGASARAGSRSFAAAVAAAMAGEAAAAPAGKASAAGEAAGDAAAAAEGESAVPTYDLAPRIAGLEALRSVAVIWEAPRPPDDAGPQRPQPVGPTAPQQREPAAAAPEKDGDRAARETQLQHIAFSSTEPWGPPHLELVLGRLSAQVAPWRGVRSLHLLLRGAPAARLLEFCAASALAPALEELSLERCAPPALEAAASQLAALPALTALRALGLGFEAWPGGDAVLWPLLAPLAGGGAGRPAALGTIDVQLPWGSGVSQAAKDALALAVPGLRVICC